MHTTSMKTMNMFKDKYLANKYDLIIVDVGSQDINGSYRELFNEHNYIGLDIVPGKNVDIIGWDTIEDNSIDVVISGQAFEHVEDDEQLMKDIVRVLKPGSYCCIIAPSAGPEHCGKDYRRYTPEIFNSLAKQVGLEVIETTIDMSHKIWKDCILIARAESTSIQADKQEIKPKPSNLPIMSKLNLGCGYRKLQGYINLDIQPRVKPDIVCNVEEGLPYDDNTFVEIYAWDFLEHIHLGKTIFVMDEIYRVLKPGGKLSVFVPSTDGRGAFQDPTHVSFWNINSWIYYMDNAHRNLYGIKAKFKGNLQDVVNGSIIHTKGELYAVK